MKKTGKSLSSKATEALTKTETSKSLMSIVADVMAIDQRLEFILGEGGQFEHSDVEEYITEVFQVPQEQLAEKVNSYCWLIASLEANAQKFEDRAEALKARAVADTKKAEWLRGRLMEAMRLLNLEKFETRDFPGIRIKEVGGMQKLSVCTLWQGNLDSVPARFKNETEIPAHVEVSLDNKAIRKALESDGALYDKPDDDETPPVKLAWLEPRGKKLVIQ